MTLFFFELLLYWWMPTNRTLLCPCCDDIVLCSILVCLFVGLSLHYIARISLVVLALLFIVTFQTLTHTHTHTHTRGPLSSCSHVCSPGDWMNKLCHPIWWAVLLDLITAVNEGARESPPVCSAALVTLRCCTLPTLRPSVLPGNRRRAF